MSGPTKGTLRIHGLFDIPDCSPDFLWSDDSRYLAASQWRHTIRRRVRVLIVDTDARAVYASRARFKIAMLETFVGGTLTGIESPVHDPRPIRIAVAEIGAAFETIDLATK